MKFFHVFAKLINAQPCPLAKVVNSNKCQDRTKTGANTDRFFAEWKTVSEKPWLFKIRMGDDGSRLELINYK